MSEITCIIIDDEPLARDILESYIAKSPQLKLVGKCRNAMEAKELLLVKKVNLMFVDINMPEISGLTFVKSLDDKPLFIFTTAYSEYAIDGFNLEAIDFLLKPISFERFEKSILKVAEYYQLRNDNQVSESDLENDFIYIKANQQMQKVAYADISYVEAFADYVKIYLPNRKIVTLQTMKNMEEKLPKDQFIRIHRSFIVNQKHISSYSPTNCKIGENILPVGKSYKDAFSNLMKNNKSL